MSDYLAGGRPGIYKEADCVIRSADVWTKDVHLFLRYLHDQGFDKVPFPFGIDSDGRETVSFVKGNVYHDVLPKDAKSDQVLVSFCGLIKAFHDLGEKYIARLTGKEPWMLPIRMPIETMCHGDLAPYNIVIEGDQVVGIIDFDTLHPGSRLWDLSYALYRWLPLMSPNNPENFGSEADKHRRFDLFVQAYGLKDVDSRFIVKQVILRLEYLVNYMVIEADGGNVHFKKNIEEGHLAQYERDINYIKQNW